VRVLLPGKQWSCPWRVCTRRLPDLRAGSSGMLGFLLLALVLGGGLEVPEQSLHWGAQRSGHP
jgi:hypothetical protein